MKVNKASPFIYDNNIFAPFESSADKLTEVLKQFGSGTKKEGQLDRYYDRLKGNFLNVKV